MVCLAVVARSAIIKICERFVGLPRRFSAVAPTHRHPTGEVAEMVIASPALSVSAEAPGLLAPRIPRIFIVSDVRLLCDGLSLSMAQQPSVTVVGSAELAAAPERIAELRPDVVLLDVCMRGALDLPVSLRQALPDVKVVAIAVADVEQDVFACAEAGVSGFVSRNGSIQDLVTAVHCAVRNELVCSPRIAALLFSRVGAKRTSEPGHDALTAREHDTLTRREREIVSLMTAGLSNKEIARQLRIQNATVKNHIHSILGKLQVRRRGEVAARMRGAAPAHAAQ
jgi:two-component system nitrate/nitrite response regulator NarL